MIHDEAEARAWIHALPRCDDVARARLDKLAVMLIEENARQNLIAKPSAGAIWQRHFADSAQLLHYVPRETPQDWLDLGTGAGFPGLIIAILMPEVKVTMAESRARRIAWLNYVLNELCLSNGAVAAMRLEQLASFSADVISARAFAPLPDLLELSARFSTPKTLWLLPKGRSAAQELEALTGWGHTFHVEQSLTSADAGIVVGNLLGPIKGRKS